MILGDDSPAADEQLEGADIDGEAAPSGGEPTRPRLVLTS